MRFMAGLLLLFSTAAFAADGRSAKELFFDRDYAAARQAWEALHRSGEGPEARRALYWMARCSESLGEQERALREYGAFLDERPGDRFLAEEARTNRAGLATRLYKAGKKQYLPVVLDALGDQSKSVRYFAALQLAGLGPKVGRPAIPVLEAILCDEKDPDLVDRAKLALLRLDPQALAKSPCDRSAPPTKGKTVRWLKVRVTPKGQSRPTLSINLPISLAELLFKALPEDAQTELERKGFDEDTFWSKVRDMGPSTLVDIQDEGERVEVWVE
jgi:tetratricopeptide (TPR) repeat protein